ncbi:hypothetical protein [Nocardiopsis tropica]|uniref:Uncharacterized protein n=1 Tax=Nocardiopsis tropica TaxID=109330 RepID=A0ABU7KR42_9ACTN|nr:hypothetical protein [Nocardiopsis umidischolae]MEE2051752.1 hypothetical protein [Nocardiopsis umidischolae]
MTTPDWGAILALAAPLIDATVARTGRPREEYEAYLTRKPAEGVEWSTAIRVRLDSLAAGPLPDRVAREISQMVPSHSAPARRASAA